MSLTFGNEKGWYLLREPPWTVRCKMALQIRVTRAVKWESDSVGFTRFTCLVRGGGLGMVELNRLPDN